MTNYEWLLNMGGEERQAWFDADHVDANDVLTRKGDVRADDVCANDVDVAQDSREKLEADVRQILHSAYMLAWMHGNENRRGSSFEKLHVEFYNLLDRQVAITERELCKQCDWPSLAAQPDYESQGRIVALTNKVDELTAERDVLADDLLTCNKEREEYRELFSKALTQAAEIVNLQP